MADADVSQYLMTRMALPEGQTLQTLLDSETYELLQKKCGELGFPIEAVSGFKPSIVMTTLSVLELQNIGFGEAAGVDAYYLAKAKKENKTLGFLETLEMQVDVLTTMGDGYENDYVRYSLNELESTEDTIDALISNWRYGAAAFTEEILAEMAADWPALYKSLLVDRNRAWLPRLEGYLSDAPVEFVIVGMAHLHGPDGLLRQLEDSGCTVEQLR